MPLIRYTFRHEEGHELAETDYFAASGDDFKTVEAFVAQTMPTAVLVKIEIQNPFIHPHEWTRTHQAGNRVYYYCGRCDVTAYRTINNFTGEHSTFHRDDKFKSVKFEWCRDPLKEMPSAKSLFR